MSSGLFGVKTKFFGRLLFLSVFGVGCVCGRFLAVARVSGGVCNCVSGRWGVCGGGACFVDRYL